MTPHHRLEDLLIHAEWLRRLATGLLGRDDTEDAVQETWVRAMQAPPGAASPGPWLAAVLKNVVRNRWRGRRVRAAADAALAAEPVPVESSPQELLERAQLQRLLAELVTELDEPYRATVLMRYYEGRSAAEIARALGVPAGTVRWRLKEGLDRLRAHLDRKAGAGNWRALISPLVATGTAPPVAAASGSPAVLGKWGMALAALALASLTGGVLYCRAKRAKEDGLPTVTATQETPPPRVARPPTWDEAEGLPAAHIEGEVRDPQGHALPNVQVALARTLLDDPARGRRPLATTVSDASGRFAFRDIRPGDHRLSASLVGHLPSHSPVLPLAADATRRVVLVLSPGGVTLTAQVVDAGGGPIRYARVIARLASAGGPLSPDQPPRLFACESDEAGRCALTVAPREYTVCVEADGYATEEATVSLTRDLMRVFKLDPAGRVRGRVLHALTGAPIAGASVKIYPLVQLEDGTMSSAQTDGEGRFSFNDLRVGSYRVTATARAVQGSSGPVHVVAASTVEGLELSLSLPASDEMGVLQGRVREEDGRPVAGLRVQTNGGAATTAQNGSFRIADVPFGRQDVRIGQSPEGWSADPVAVTVGPHEAEPLDIVVRPGTILWGRVLGPQGAVVSGAHLRTNTAPWLSTESDENGLYRLVGLAPGKTTLKAWHPEQGVAAVKVDSLTAGHSHRLDIRLTPGGTIAGIVRYEDGTPAAAISVALTGQDGVAHYLSVSTGDDGRFEAHGLLPGRYTVRARRKAQPWNSSTRSERPYVRLVAVGPEARVDGVELSVPRGGHALRGLVLLPGGTPATGTRVVANAGDWRPRGHGVEHTAVTDAAGRFRIEDVEAGTFTLWAIHPGLPMVETGGVAADGPEATIRLMAGARVAGVVTDKQGRPVTEFMLNVVPAEGRTPEERDAIRRALFQQRPVSDPGGAFIWDGLSAGRHEVVVSARGAAAARQTVTLGEGEDKQGLRLVLDLGVRLTGKVVDLETGAPITGAHVGARTTGRMADARTSAAGTFELSGFLPGDTVELSVRAHDSAAWVPERLEVEVRPGAPAMDLGIVKMMKGDWLSHARDRGTVGFTARPRGGRFVIDQVRPGSPAAVAGLRSGDVVVAVDQREVRDLGAGAVNYLLTRPPGERVEISVEATTGERRTTSLTAVAFGALPKP